MRMLALFTAFTWCGLFILQRSSCKNAVKAQSLNQIGQGVLRKVLYKKAWRVVTVTVFTTRFGLLACVRVMEVGKRKS